MLLLEQAVEALLFLRQDQTDGSAAFAIFAQARLPDWFFRGSFMWFMCSLRPAGSIHACSPPRLTATQLAQSAVLNRLIAPVGLAPTLTPASRAHAKCK